MRDEDYVLKLLKRLDMDKLKDKSQEEVWDIAIEHGRAIRKEELENQNNDEIIH